MADAQRVYIAKRTHQLVHVQLQTKPRFFNKKKFLFVKNAVFSSQHLPSHTEWE
jgi:hypothetical protein